MANFFNTTIIGVSVHPFTFSSAIQLILSWAKVAESCYVCVANVHLVMESYDDPDYRSIVNVAGMVTPDGMPLDWVLRRMGHTLKGRVYGSILTLWVLETAAQLSLPVGFLGASPDVLAALNANVRKQFHYLNIAYSYSPSFIPETYPYVETFLCKKTLKLGYYFFVISI